MRCSRHDALVGARHIAVSLRDGTLKWRRNLADGGSTAPGLLVVQGWDQDAVNELDLHTGKFATVLRGDALSTTGGTRP